MNAKVPLLPVVAVLLIPVPGPAAPGKSHFDNSGYDDVLSGGARMIEIATPEGTLRSTMPPSQSVWGTPR